jgi:heme-degrading monooxygenase HmoA
VDGGRGNAPASLRPGHAIDAAGVLADLGFQLFASSRALPASDCPTTIPLGDIVFARLVTFSLEPGNGPTTERLANEQGPIIRRLPGFESLAFLHDDAANRYGSFSVWQTRKNAEAVSGVATLQIKDALKSSMKGRPSVTIYEIYPPRA